LNSGGGSYEDMGKRGFRRFSSFFSAVMLAGVFGVAALLAIRNGSQSLGWALASLASLLGIYVVIRFLDGLTALWTRLFHRPMPIFIDPHGVTQTASDGKRIELAWEDIRVVRHKRSSHIIRGKDRNQRIEISTLLFGHQDLSAFIKFAFLLRQEVGASWTGFLGEVRARLAGPGFYFHYDGDRKNTVHITQESISHTSPEGDFESMSWELMKESVFETKKNMLVFRHTGSRQQVSLPCGTDSDQIIEHFIRWALHTEPSFSDKSR
jgi:hypothetical protein